MIDGAVQTLRKGGLYTIGGAAGTGKTTIIKEIVKAAKVRVAVVAYTGKAASVLRKKGVQATTIHSLIYSYDRGYERFVLKRELEGVDAIIIDEASMVGKGLYKDLQSFGLPIVAVGDPYQLEPVGDAMISLLDKPDLLLEKIHRQAEGSEIVRLATAIRQRERIRFGGCVKRRPAKLPDPAGEDIVLCGMNKTRTAINSARLAGSSTPIVVLQNDSRLGVFNGELFVSDGDKATNEEGRVVRLRDIIWDYAYALTVHKAQGSEWGNVVVIDECELFDPYKWRYTAITRAKEGLTWYV